MCSGCGSSTSLKRSAAEHGRLDRCHERARDASADVQRAWNERQACWLLSWAAVPRHAAPLPRSNSVVCKAMTCQWLSECHRGALLRPQLVLPSRATLTGSVSPCTSVMHLTKALARGPGPCRVVSIIVTGRPLRLGGILKAIGKCFPTLLTLCLCRPFAVRWVRSWQRTRCHDDADNATSSRRASAVVR